VIIIIIVIINNQPFLRRFNFDVPIKIKKSNKKQMYVIKLEIINGTKREIAEDKLLAL
jgi:hypothetical protein